MEIIRTVEQFIRLAPKTGPRVLCLDIETFPIIAYVWSLFKQNVGLNQIKEDWKMMSFSVEWLHCEGNYYADNRHAENPRDDLLTLTKLYRILKHADFIVAQNGKKFDMRKIKARFALEGYRPFAMPQIIDTLLLNKDEFAFTSLKQEFVTHALNPDNAKDSHKDFPGFELWVECMSHNPLAWAGCEKYNRQDVASMKEMYLRLRGWYSRHPNVAIFIEDAGRRHTCGTCGSHHVRKAGLARTQVGVYQKYHCKDCGKYSRGRKLVRNQKERAHVLVSA